MEPRNLTASDYRVASTETSRVQSKSYRAGRRTGRPSIEGPGGVVHAFDTEATETACGLPLDGLKRWKLPWHQGMYDRCAACNAATRFGS
jgi:hypothetical protein